MASGASRQQQVRRERPREKGAARERKRARNEREEKIRRPGVAGVALLSPGRACGVMGRRGTPRAMRRCCCCWQLVAKFPISIISIARRRARFNLGAAQPFSSLKSCAAVERLLKLFSRTLQDLCNSEDEVRGEIPLDENISRVSGF